MSAFIVSETHLQTLVHVALIGPRDAANWNRVTFRWFWHSTREANDITADRVGAMLRAENERSVAYRYRESPSEDAPFGYRPTLARAPTIVETLKAIDCYEYQSCETDDWEKSEAYAFCDALRRRLCGELPGYDRGRGWDDWDRPSAVPPVADARAS